MTPYPTSFKLSQIQSLTFSSTEPFLYDIRARRPASVPRMSCRDAASLKSIERTDRKAYGQKSKIIGLRMAKSKAVEAAEGDRPGSKKQTFDEEHKMQKCETQPMACSCLHSLKARDVGPSAERSPSINNVMAPSLMIYLWYACNDGRGKATKWR